MAKAISWDFEGLDQETRDAARAAARRSGKTLEDWLDEAIHESARAELRRVGVEDDDRAEERRPGGAQRFESRMEQERAAGRVAAMEAALRELERRLAAIVERSDAASQGGSPVEPTPGREMPKAAPARRPLADAVAEIARRQRALERGDDEAGDRNSRDERRPDVAEQIERLRLELEGVSRALANLAPRASVAAVEAALRELTERIETQRNSGVRDDVVSPLERLTSELRAIVAELDPSRIVRNLRDEARALAEKLAARPAGGADSSTFGDVVGQTCEIRDLLRAIASRPAPVDRLEANLAALAARVDELARAGRGDDAKDMGRLLRAIRSIVAAEASGAFAAFAEKLEQIAAKIDGALAKTSDARFDRIGERIERLHEDLAARLERVPAPEADASQVEQLVTRLAKKIDEALDPTAPRPALDEIGRRIERLEERLPARGRHAGEEAGERLGEIADKITKKLDEALDSRADRAFFASLEKQIERLSEGIERSGDGLASLSAIERAIAELSRRIDEGRGAAAQAAENAARRAAQEVLREAGAKEAERRAERSLQADFIAAARRAARQTADEEPETAAPERERDAADGAPAGSEAEEPRPPDDGPTKPTRKRPLLLGFAALALVVGVYHVARIGVGVDARRLAALSTRVKPAVAPVAQAPAPAQAVDPTPVGAIGPAATRRDAISAIRELAAKGDAAAQFELGVRHVEGHGVVRDPKAGMSWLEKAAAQGLAPAQYRLGSLYEKGVGVDRDYAQARAWYQRAAQAGNARAMHNLAVLYAGGGDSKPDYVSAAFWFRKAAEYGVRDSQFNLAILSARGLGVPQNFVQSYMWFSVAAAQGDEDAAKKRDEIAARLDSRELSAAKALIDSFRPKQPDKAGNETPGPEGGWEKLEEPAAPETKPLGKQKVSAS